MKNAVVATARALAAGILAGILTGTILGMFVLATLLGNLRQELGCEKQGFFDYDCPKIERIIEQEAEAWAAYHRECERLVEPIDA